ncbi:MAG: hypothetical protein GC153_00765 [Alphaproteobacteria bacterium]|nr:hypothetical protein [Alphaproteobacteria bacterium]
MANQADETSGEKKDAATGAPPVVEAEVVDAEFSDAPDEDRNEPAGNEAPGAEADKPAGPAVMSTWRLLRAGQTPAFAIFILFVVIAAAAFAVFFVERGNAPPPVAAGRPAASPQTVPEGDGQSAAEAPKPSKPDESAMGGGTAPAAPADAAKIANDARDDAKAAPITDFDAAKAPASARGLPPPPPPGNTNEALQEAAKQALSPAPAAGGDDNGDAIDAPPPETDSQAANAEPPQTDDTPHIDFSVDGASGALDTNTKTQTLPENGASPEAGAAPPQSAEPTRAASLATPSSSTSELVKTLRAESGEENAAHAADIAALKESFERELAERDARANAQIADLRNEIDKLKSGFSGGGATTDPSAAVALAALERVVARGAPFQDELNEFARYARSAAPVAALRPIAAKGAPTADELKESFDPAARAALAAASREGANGFAGILAEFPKLFSARPARPQPGSTPRAVISRAEAAIDKGDVAGAVDELSVLRGGAAEAFAPWLEQARARLAADQALTALNDAYLGEYQN